MHIDPILNLGIDNCFASKRWTHPEQWCKLIAELGIQYIEASADTECDPLYMGIDYTEDWSVLVRRACEKNNVRIASLYSGHGTYTTLGLAHWDTRVRVRFRDRWIKQQARTAASLEAGLGFFAHAFDESVLQSSGAYADAMGELCCNLADIAGYAKSIELSSVGVEQMYTPHQPPWTITCAKEMLCHIYAIGGAPFYLTDDVGHMNGQQYFLRPTEESILRDLSTVRIDSTHKRIWMGSRQAMQAFRNACDGVCSDAQAVHTILIEAERYPYLFADPRDCSPYTWLEETGCWSPIIHLQQSDGKTSPHWAFDDMHNKKGIIFGEQVLRALTRAYKQDVPANMPPPCSCITLTLEPFIGTAGNIYDAMDELYESVSYWRRFIPKDGMRLSELTARLNIEDLK